MTDAAEAIDIAARAAPGLGLRERALLVAIGGLETHWGDWFAQPDGTPSNNWGAVTAGGGWSGPTFEHQDSRWTPAGNVAYITRFRVYDSPEAGAADLASLLRSQYQAALAAAERGDWYGASRALYKSGYYSGTKPEAGAIADHYRRLSEFLCAQGINPAVLAAAGGFEFLLWLGIGYALVKRRGHK